MELSNGREIKTKECKSYIARYRIPKQIIETMLIEMESMRLLSRVKTYKADFIKIINCKLRENEYENLNRLTRRRKQIDKIINAKEGFFDF